MTKVLNSSFDNKLNMLKRVRNIIKNEKVFEDNYKPEKILFRKDIIDNLANNTFNLLLTYGWGDNAFIYGESGTGKTLTIKYLSRELQNLRSDVKVIYINCSEFETKYQIIKKILSSLKEKEDIKRGLITYEYLEMIKEYLKNANIPVLIILDEAHSLKKEDRESLLYNLSRMKEQDDIGDSKVTIITITNEIFFQDSLSTRTLSSYKGYSVVFSPYTCEQLEEILLQRAKEGLIDGSYDLKAIKRIAYNVAEKYKGDARRAILILKKSSELVENKLTEKEVEEAMLIIERNEMQKYVLDMNDTRLILLKIITNLMKKGKTPFFDLIYYQYKNIQRKRREEVQSERNIYRMLDKIEETGLIIKKYSNKRNFYLIENSGDFLEEVIDSEIDRRGISLVGYEDGLEEWIE